MKMLHNLTGTLLTIFILWSAIGATFGQTTNATTARGIRCLSCHEVSSPASCKQWVTCGQDEMCFVREYLNRNMNTVYHLGCELKAHCDLYDRIGELFGRKRATSPHCFQCCGEDDCNDHLCPTNNGDIASKRDLRCLECHTVSDPGLCDRWVRCEQDEACYTRSFIDSEGQLKFKLGCEFKPMCHVPMVTQSLTTGSVTTTPDPRVCEGCCENNDCNAELCKHALDIKPTPERLHDGCRDMFERGGDSCYYFSNITSTWLNSNNACKNLGAQLAIVTSLNETDDIEDLLNNTALNTVSGYWIGGYYPYAIKQWQWVDLTDVEYTNWGPNQPSASSYTYSIVIINPSKNTGYTGWEWATATSTSAYYYICETEAVDGMEYNETVTSTTAAATPVTTMSTRFSTA